MVLRSVLLSFLLATGTLVLGVAPPANATTTAAASTVIVTSAADSGADTFRDAVADANNDPAIDTIEFADAYEVTLLSEVEFAGPQELTIEGAGSTLSGSGVDPDTDTWDSGLFVATGGGSLSIDRLAFADSFNNGLAVFVPEGVDPVTISLRKVSVDGTQFHGILVDAQSSTGYNTDDVPHEACTDPYAVDAGVEVTLDIDKIGVTGAGRIEGFDTSLDTGCPQDFDGLRVDQGGEFGIGGTIRKSVFVDNLADGTELDETGKGFVDIDVKKSVFSDNGETVSLDCIGYEEYENCEDGQVTDLDDGFDIDETGPGGLIADVSRTVVRGNFDEGLDFDEAGRGTLDSTITRVRARDNNDEAFKASEEGAGDNLAALSRCAFRDGGDDGAQIEEADSGTVTINVSRCTISGNAKAGIAAEEADDGPDGTIRVRRSDLSDNSNGPLDLTNVDEV